MVSPVRITEAVREEQQIFRLLSSSPPEEKRGGDGVCAFFASGLAPGGLAFSGIGAWWFGRKKLGPAQEDDGDDDDDDDDDDHDVKQKQQKR